MSEAVKHPSHYNSLPAKCTCGRPIECIQVVEHLGFNTGSAMKYIWRAGLKGDAIQDYEKAIQFLQFEVAKLKRALARGTKRNPTFTDFVEVRVGDEWHVAQVTNVGGDGFAALVAGDAYATPLAFEREGDSWRWPVVTEQTA